MIVFEKSKGLTDVRTHYCPGCMHGTSQRIIAECLEELNVLDRDGWNSFGWMQRFGL